MSWRWRDEFVMAQPVDYVAHDPESVKRWELQRDARALLARIVDLTDGNTDADVAAWAERIGDIAPEVLDRIDQSIGTLTTLRSLLGVFEVKK